jgi:hypothetical protein
VTVVTGTAADPHIDDKGHNSGVGEASRVVTQIVTQLLVTS